MKKAISKKGKKEYEIVEEKDDSVVLMDLESREEKEIKKSTLNTSYDIEEVEDQEIDFSDVEEVEIVEEKVIKEVKKEEVKMTTKQTKKYTKDDMIPVSNYTSGKAFISNPLTFEKVILEGFGDIVEVTYGTLDYIRRSKGVKPFQKYIYIMDEDAVKQLNLDYSGMKSPNEFSDLVQSDVKVILAFIDSAPDSVVKSFKEFVISKVNSGEIDSFVKVKLLSEKLGFEA